MIVFMLFVGAGINMTRFSEFVEPFISFISWLGEIIMSGLSTLGGVLVSGIMWLVKAIGSGLSGVIG